MRKHGGDEDRIDSAAELTDSAGAITDSYSYDVFGAPRTTTGTTANSFQYTGQQRDGNANRGLYYLRARSYDPALGRFLQQDPLPLINRYAYARNSAANLTDPNGLFPCPGCGKIRHAASTAVDDVASVITDGKLGYVDLNLTACYGVCITGGVQWQVGTTEWHTYGGGGVVELQALGSSSRCPTSVQTFFELPVPYHTPHRPSA
ncbi:MAG: RHS repeat-associated core domain-containing protein [Chloroflexota bacterium]|nr:RHS repeat-associated core domain-containing protein [Chloroflexota bacterium]